ncbi:hypothetical protein TWF481_008524 [Arthrobotrys musiformis]|uniref:G domain-containing protein n=1 Tax=Arthrobotrys musiformis TaxID=47236 RepID=A0AAV9W7D8_9PEZI
MDDSLRDLGMPYISESSRDKPPPEPVLETTPDTSPASEVERYILVTGAPGAGKSTFIADALSPGEHTARIELLSVSREPAEFKEIPITEPINGFKTVLVEIRGFDDNFELDDTPGFDGTHKGNALAFVKTAKWLEGLHRANKVLSGIIYLHRIDIAKNRVPGSAVHSIRLLEAISGNAFAPNIMLVCNMWGLGARLTWNYREDGVYTQREEELRTKEEFWGPLVRNGASTTRYNYHYRPTDSTQARTEARDVILRVLNNSTAEITQFGREVVIEKKPIAETEACMAFLRYLVESGAAENEKEAERAAESFEGINPAVSAAFYKEASRARERKARIQKEWELLASLVEGLEPFLAALAEKCGYPLVRNGSLSLTEAAAIHLGGLAPAPRFEPIYV